MRVLHLPRKVSVESGVSLLPDPVRLLFDENLSARLCAALADIYPSAFHIRDSGLGNAPDSAIWRYAGQSGDAIVSKDEDFKRLSVLYGPPPKVIWLRLGNCSTHQIIDVLRRRRDEIEVCLADREAAILALA